MKAQLCFRKLIACNPSKVAFPAGGRSRDSPSQDRDHGPAKSPLQLQAAIWFATMFYTNFNSSSSFVNAKRFDRLCCTRLTPQRPARRTLICSTGIYQSIRHPSNLANRDFDRIVSSIRRCQLSLDLQRRMVNSIEMLPWTIAFDRRYSISNQWRKSPVAFPPFVSKFLILLC